MITGGNQRDWLGHSQALRGRRRARRDHWPTRERAERSRSFDREKRYDGRWRCIAPEDLDRLFAVVKEKHGHIDVLFANAGWGEVAPLETATEAHFDKTFDLNAKGTFFTVQKALPLFKDGGSIILTSSVANVRGDAAFTAYAASKAAVRCFARGWTVELKDRKIRVNSMSPGPIETPALENAGLTAEQVKQAAAQFASEVPLGRRGKPEEVAAAVVFLASDESSYITGVDLAVDGGMAQV